MVFSPRLVQSQSPNSVAVEGVRKMSSIRGAFVAATVALALIIPAAPAHAKCVKKAGQGTNTTLDGAKFQAWEAVLQATDWSMWFSWITSNNKVGKAPGYRVTGFRKKCKKGGLGYTCILQATLCK